MQAIVFCNDPEVAPALAEHLAALGVPTVHISARLPQPARLAAMAALRALGARVAVTSDVLSRGIDLEYVNAVVNFDLPADGATYAHRLGRCGRFGAAAVAVTLVTSEEELERLRRWADTCSSGAPPSVMLFVVLFSLKGRESGRFQGSWARLWPRQYGI